MRAFDLALTVLGVLVLVLGLLSVRIERFPLLSRPIVSMLVGILIGPAVLGWLDPEVWHSRSDHPGAPFEAVARLTIGIALMGVALRLPSDYFRKNWKSMLVVLGLVMPAMWLSAGTPPSSGGSDRSA